VFAIWMYPGAPLLCSDERDRLATYALQGTDLSAEWQCDQRLIDFSPSRIYRESIRDLSGIYSRFVSIAGIPSLGLSLFLAGGDTVFELVPFWARHTQKPIPGYLIGRRGIAICGRLSHQADADISVRLLRTR
jgi:hypothetical protein